jgi:hypothetical protein
MPIRLATVLATCALAACASAESDDDDVDQLDELNGGKADGDEWLGIGNGVAYRRVNAGNAVVIAYGGYSARLVYSAAWGTELIDAKLGAADVGHVYAVKGPAQANYAAREIGNSKLRAHLATLDDTASPIYAVAHSSGSFVAHELFGQLHAGRDQHARAHLRREPRWRLRFTQAIAASSAGSRSCTRTIDAVPRPPQNAGTAIALGTAYADHGVAFEVTVPDTGCVSGAGWCLHDVVITHRPHDPATYDLARDYVDFVDRPVTTEYLDLFVTESLIQSKRRIRRSRCATPAPA